MNSLNIASLIIGIIGSICIAIYTYPTLIKVLTTKDTSNISLIMFIILGIGCLGFITNGILSICTTSSPDTQTIITNVSIIISNGLSFISSSILVTIKLIHINQAKKHNISESEWCTRLKKK